MTITTEGTASDRRIAELKAVFARGVDEGLGVGASLGIRLEDVEPGKTVYYLDPNPATVNAMFTVHGGVLATLMDTAMGSALYTMLADGHAYTTLELKVNFIRAVPINGSRLTCRANTIHVGRTTGTSEAKITDANGKLIGHGTCTMMIFTAPDYQGPRTQDQLK